MSRSIVWAGLPLLVLACAGSARAGVIVSVTGDAAIVTPAAGTNLNNNNFGTSSGTLLAFDERSGVTVAGLAVDSTPSLLSGVVDSHLLHFDQSSGNGPQAATGTVTFSGEILGLYWTGDGLDGSDGQFARDNVTYPRGSGAVHRWLESNDDLSISADHRTLTFDWRITGHFDQVRVLTAANPAPPSLLLLVGAAGSLGLTRLVRRRRA